MRVGGEDAHGRRPGDDLIGVHRDGIEARRLAGEHRVSASVVGQLDVARDAHLAAVARRRHFASRGYRGDLQTPTTAEDRRVGPEDLPRQLDLRADLRDGPIGVERGAGPDEAVVVGDRRVEQPRVVRWVDDVGGYFAGELAQYRGVEVTRRGAPASDMPLVGISSVAVNDEDA